MAGLDTVLQWILAAALLASGSAGLLVGAYLVAVSVASFFYRLSPLGPAPSHHLVVLIPAHDEAELIGRCLASLRNQDYPSELFRVVVIADNCTDSTARVASGLGAEVLERHAMDLPGKGRALRWAMQRILSEPNAPDAFVVVDADSVADRRLLTALAAEFQAGHPAVQGAYLALNERPDSRLALGAVALLLFHFVRFAGRQVLGMAASLVGNGMLLGADLMRATPWDAFSVTEDLEYTVTLRCAGVRPRFAGAARIYAPVALSGTGARSQRRRWEGGRFFVVRNRLPALIRQAVRRADWPLLDEVLELVVPPLGLLALVVVTGSAIALLLTAIVHLPAWLLLPWLGAALALPLYTVLGLIAARAPAAAYLALLRAPLFLARKVGIYVSLLREFDPQRWVRTPRPAELNPNRVRIAGVPLDAVDMTEAIRRLIAAVPSKRLLQVCTINLDFLVRARADPAIRSIFEESDLNLADGLPVVWLSRLQGDRLPQRVAGADLVPVLMREAARHGASVFLLGGERGVARDAAARLRQTIPGLRVAGWLEPPRSPIEAMDNATIVREINESGADILLVALGHPKQDRWIAMQRPDLQVSVAIGVGCCLDLIAGRVRRAPLWMQRLGLEWLFRALQEPRRLASRYAVDLGSLLGLFLLPALWQRISRGTSWAP